jgi:hypothetical protein
MSLFYKRRLVPGRSSIAIVASILYLGSTIIGLPVAASGIRAGSAKILPTARSTPSPQSLPKIPLDTTIVPGKRVGVITPQTTYAALVNIFGKQRLTPKKVYGPEGQVVFPGTLITLGKNRSLTVAWKDAKKLQPLQVIINDPAWKTTSGIGIGTSLAKLRQILGEFKITGLYWDYGNHVIGLSPAMQARYTGLSITVDADRVAAREFPKDLKAVTGDGVAPASNNPHWKPLKMHVSGLTLYFPEAQSPKLGK